MRGNSCDLAALARLHLERQLDASCGFLPPRVPLGRLAGPFARIFDACADLPNRYPRGGGVRRWLDREFARDDPPVRRAIDLLGAPERDALAVALCVLGHTYRWDGAPPARARFAEQRIPLPPGLLGPWRHVARLTGQPRVGTMWTLHLNNWRMIDRPGGAAYRVQELTPDNVRVAHNWLLPPIDQHLDRFSISFVLLEAQGAEAVRALVEAVEGAASGDVERTHAALALAHSSVAALTRAFSRNVSRRTVDPETWLRIVQPTFVWSAEAGRAGKIEGGPSGLQLPTIQALDAALGITGNSALARLALTARLSMPAAHRRFLAVLDRCGPVLRDFVAGSRSPGLTRAHDACVRAVVSFRATHRARGEMYLRHRPETDAVRASTGLVIEIEAEPISAFHRSMTARIRETESAVLAPGAPPRAAVTS